MCGKQKKKRKCDDEKQTQDEARFDFEFFFSFFLSEYGLSKEFRSPFKSKMRQQII